MKQDTTNYVSFTCNFAKYRWFKPLLTGLLCVVFYLIFTIVIGAIVGIYAGLTGDYESIQAIAAAGAGYDAFDAYSVGGALLTLGGIAVGIPALILANLCTRWRPFSSYVSTSGKFKVGDFFKYILLALVIIGIPNAVFVLIEDPVFGPVHFTVAGFILCLILGPLQCAAEEFVFRGLEMQALGGWFKTPLLAVVLQAVPFMLAHPYNIWGKLEVLFTGIVLGLLAYLTNGLEASIALHIVNNMVLFIMNGFGFESIQTEVPPSSFFTVVVFESVLVAGVLFFQKKGWVSKHALLLKEPVAAPVVNAGNVQ